VAPTSKAAFRSSYPCELLTRQVARVLLSVKRVRRIGAQTLGPRAEQCVYARGRYKAVPQVGLLIFSDERLYGEDSFAQVQRRIARTPTRGGTAYRVLSGLGERAFIVSYGRHHSEVAVMQEGRAYTLTLRLKQKPRTVAPPLAELERAARRISAQFEPR